MFNRLTGWAVLATVFFYMTLGSSSRSQVLSPDDTARKFRPNEVIVEIRTGASIDDVNQRNHTTTIRRIYGTNYYRLGIPKDVKEANWIERLKADVDVLDAWLNPVVTSPFTAMSRSIMSFPDGFVGPGRTAQEYQAQFEALDQLLKLGDSHLRSTGQGITVAVIDTGIDLNHPVLASRMWTDERDSGDIAEDGIDNDNDGLIDDYRGWDFIGNDNDPTETAADPRTTVAGHGTFIAGLIAQVAPDCRIIPIRAFTPLGESDEFTVAEAIKYAADHDAQVINLSFGSPEDSPVLREAIYYAARKNVLVAAAGNENTAQPPQYPANISESVIGVAAVEMTDHRAYFSNYGSAVSVNAPGCQLISAYPGGGYASWSGTSFSTPMVVSQAALIIAFECEASETREVIENTALPIDFLNPGYEGMLGRGRIQPLEALQSLLLNPLMDATVDFRSNVEMSPVAGGTLASAEASILVSGSTQELRIGAQGLEPRSRYQILIDGVLHPAGWLISSSFGAIDARLSNESSGAELLPDPLDPVTGIGLIELRDEKNNLILAGSFDSSSTEMAPEQSLFKEALLMTPGSVSSVAGKARIEVDSIRESLSINVERLTTGSGYQILVDGINLGQVNALSRLLPSGFAKITYTSDESSGHLLVEALRPAINIGEVRVLNLSGQTVAIGVFRSDIEGISAAGNR